MTDVWLTTYTGKKFYPTKCTPNDICIESIVIPWPPLRAEKAYLGKFRELYDHNE